MDPSPEALSLLTHRGTLCSEQRLLRARHLAGRGRGHRGVPATRCFPSRGAPETEGNAGRGGGAGPIRLNPWFRFRGKLIHGLCLHLEQSKQHPELRDSDMVWVCLSK